MNNSTKQINIYLMVRILILNFIIGFLYFFIASEGISKNVFLYVLIVTNMIFIFLSIFRNIAGYGNNQEPRLHK